MGADDKQHKLDTAFIQKKRVPVVSLDGILAVGGYTRRVLAYRCGGRGGRVGIHKARNRRTGERVLDRQVVDLCNNQ